MEFLGTLLAPIAVVFVFSCLFIMIGFLISKDIFEENNSCFHLALCFFVGMVYFLALLRTAALIIHSYRIAFWLVLTASVGWGIWNIIRNHFQCNEKRILVQYRKLIYLWGGVVHQHFLSTAYLVY